jgi:pyruvate formate lyase activating enzyme
MTTGFVHSFESMGALDGPGLRFIAFLSGCPLRCAYCHNPDTWELTAGTRMSPEEIVKKALRFKPYFKNGGGITISGGEPFFQPAFTREILRQCKAEGISTCVDTAGSVWNDEVKAALEHADLLLLDIKHTDPKRFRELTGGNPETSRAFLDYCKQVQKPLWIRQVITPGWNDTEEDIDALLRHIQGANVQKIELLPYHTLGVHKWKALGIPYPLEGVNPPNQAIMDKLRDAIAKAVDGQSL